MQDDETGSERASREPAVPGVPGVPGGGAARDGSFGSTGYGDGGYGGGLAGPPEGYGGWGGIPGGYGETPPPPRRRRRGRVTVYALVAILAAGVGAGTALGLDTHATSSTGTGISSNDVPGPPANARAGSGSLNARSVEGKLAPGVVDIDAAIQYSGGTSSEGTGMIINSDGLVLTNNHVIDGAQVVKVTVAATGRAYTATVLGYDNTQDVALLRIRDAAGLKAVSVGNSSDVTLGMPVLALGNAQGQGGRPKAARGIINSLDKTISPTDESTGATETLHGMLQTTADIVSGDSGGPLANAAGQVIGMDTANATSSQGSSSVLGYAIPINTALSVARQIAQKQASGTIQIGVPGFLGVLVPQSASSSPRQEAQQQRQQEQQQGGSAAGPASPGRRCITNDADTSLPSAIAPASSGALVDGVLCGTAAASAGLASGDVITSVNGQDVTTPGSLTTIMGKYHPGDRVTLHWVTLGGQRRTGTLTLSAAPAR